MTDARELRLAIRAELSGHALTEGQIADRLGVPVTRARTALRMLASRDVVIGLHEGHRGVRYRLWSEVAGEMRGRPRVLGQAFPDVPGHRGAVVA